MAKPQTSRPRVLIIHSGTDSHFADRDRQLLQDRYRTATLGFSGLREWPHLHRQIRDADVAMFWFVGRAAMWGMLPPPRHTRVISLVGGYEAARVEEFNYGSALSFWKRRVLKYVFNRSHRVVTVSDYTRRELVANYGLPIDRIDIIHNAIDTGFFIPPTGPRDNNVVFTVAHIGRVLIRKKGFDILVGAAQRLPNVRFLVAGRITDEEGAEFVRRMPPNVKHLGLLAPAELLRRIQTTSVYFQPSRHESFGVAVIEAMSCGCVPVVSNLGALPEVVGAEGYILDRQDAVQAADVLREALIAPEEARRRARARVVEHFDIKLRAEKLMRLIDGLLGG